MSGAPTVELRPITDENRDAVLALRTTEAQRSFVSTVEESLEELSDEPGARGTAWGVFAGEAPVGFVMVSDDVDGPEYIAQFLWKLLIDERHQRRGYGTATLDRVVEYLSGPGVQTIWTSAGMGAGSPIPFYERYGFVQTGEIVFGGEMLLRLDLG